MKLSVTPTVDQNIEVEATRHHDGRWRAQHLDSIGKANTTIRMDGAVGGWLTWADCYPGYYVRLIQFMSADPTLDPKDFCLLSEVENGAANV